MAQTKRLDKEIEFMEALIELHQRKDNHMSQNHGIEHILKLNVGSHKPNQFINDDFTDDQSILSGVPDATHVLGTIY